MREPELTPLRKPYTEFSNLFVGIGAIKAVAPDPLALVDEQDFDKERVAWEMEHLHEDLRQTRRVNKARLLVLTFLFVLIVLWLVSVMALTAVCGLHAWGFALSDKLVMTYITSTTICVLGLFHIAAKWLFSARRFLKPSKESQSPSNRLSQPSRNA